MITPHALAQVHARFPSDGAADWYAGTVTAVDTKAQTFHVKFDAEGEEDEDWELSDIWRLVRTPLATQRRFRLLWYPRHQHDECRDAELAARACCARAVFVVDVSWLVMRAIERSCRRAARHGRHGRGAQSVRVRAKRGPRSDGQGSGSGVSRARRRQCARRGGARRHVPAGRHRRAGRERRCYSGGGAAWKARSDSALGDSDSGALCAAALLGDNLAVRQVLRVHPVHVCVKSSFES